MQMKLFNQKKEQNYNFAKQLGTRLKLFHPPYIHTIKELSRVQRGKMLKEKKNQQIPKKKNQNL